MNIKERLLKLRLATIGDIKQQTFYPTTLKTTKITTTPKKFLDKASNVVNFDYDLIKNEGSIETNSGKVSELAGIHGDPTDKVTSFSRNYEAGGDDKFFADRHFEYDEEGQHVFPVKKFPETDEKGNYTREFHEKDNKIINGVYYEGVDPEKLDDKGNIIIETKGNKILDRNIKPNDAEISDKDVSEWRKKEIFRGDELGTIEYLKRKIRRGDPMETPYFTLKNSEITGHEGRHRARALMEEGVEEMPVELTDAQPHDTIDSILGQEGSLDRLEDEMRPAEKYNSYIKRKIKNNASREKRDVQIHARNIRKRLDKMMKDTRAPIFGRYSKQRSAERLRAFTNSSSFVGNMRYDQDEQSMTGILSGKHYKWCGVPERTFDAFQGANSAGAFFNRNVKGQFDCSAGGIISESKSRISKQRTALQPVNQGIKTKHKVVMNPQHGLEIADAYDSMEHDPNNPVVKEAYDAFKSETMEQFNQLRQNGLQITKLKPNQKGYTTSEEMHKDIKENNHLFYFPSEQGFGTGEALDHPMLQGSGLIDAEGKEIPHNDIFRIVHDIQGHNLGNESDFSPEGEHAAFLTHRQQYSPIAQRALFTETAGQANWGAFNRTSGTKNRNLISKGRFNEIEFAPQKANILPDEFINRIFHE